MLQLYTQKLLFLATSGFTTICQEWKAVVLAAHKLLTVYWTPHPTCEGHL